MSLFILPLIGGTICDNDQRKNFVYTNTCSLLRLHVAPWHTLASGYRFVGAIAPIQVNESAGNPRIAMKTL
jgi:hypothetical protein